MKAAAAVLVPLLAAGLGVAGWLALRSARERPAGETGATTKAVDPELDRRLLEAALLVKAADDSEGPARKARAKQAAEILVALERDHPEDPEIPYWRGFAAVLGEDPEAAKAALERVKAKSPDRGRAPAAALLQASIWLIFEPDKLEAAVRTLKGLPSRAPSFRPQEVAAATYKALRMWATRSLKDRNGDSALRALEDAKKLVTDDPVRLFDTRVAIASALGWNGRWVEAQEAWLALEKETEGKNPDVEMGLADAYAIQNNNAEAAARMTRVLELIGTGDAVPPRYRVLREALLRRGNAYRLLQRGTEAKADLEAYVAQFPEDGRGYYWLGVLRLDVLEDPAGARSALEKARSLSPWCDQYLRTLLQVYEVAAPDAEKAAALREEIDKGTAARAKRREEIQKARGDLRNLCE
jgi:tetratricopeptide (TPR) repeat protein